MKVANSKCKTYVQSKTPFKGSNLWAEYCGDSYVVYSYGVHFPLFIYAEGAWFENEDKYQMIGTRCNYSVSTERQRQQARPVNTTVLLATSWMAKLALDGYKGIATERILRGVMV